jgi:hypothetical protein
LLHERGWHTAERPTNSHQMVAKLKSFGFDTRYEGKSGQDWTWKKKISGDVRHYEGPGEERHFSL